MEIDEHILKFVGKANIPAPLEIDHNYKVTIDGQVTAVTDSSQQNGKALRYYKFEPILAEVLKDNGEVLKAKDNRKKSVKFRNLIYKLYEVDSENTKHFDDVYAEVMKHCMLHADELYERSKRNYIE